MFTYERGEENDCRRAKEVSEVVEMFSVFTVVMVVTWGRQLSTH